MSFLPFLLAGALVFGVLAIPVALLLGPVLKRNAERYPLVEPPSPPPLDPLVPPSAEVRQHERKRRGL